MTKIPQTPPLTTEEILVLSERARAGDSEAYGIVIEKFSYIIELVKGKLRKLNVDKGAIRFGAIMGIRAALRKYTKDKGAFSPYAYVCAIGSAMREVSKTEYLIHIPNAKLNTFLKDKKAPYELVRINAQAESQDGSPVDEGWALGLNQDEFNLTMEDSSLEGIDLEQFWSLCQQVLDAPEKDAIALTYGLSSTSKENYLEKYGKTYEWFRLQKTKGLKKLKTHFTQRGMSVKDFVK